MNEQDTEVKPSPLRASNTVSTLKPVEVLAEITVPASGDYSFTVTDVPITGIEVYNESSPGVPRPKPVTVTIPSEPILPEKYRMGSEENLKYLGELYSSNTETVPPPEQQQTLFGLPEGDFESGFADDHCFAYTPDKEESVLSRRVSRLEDQVDGILDRLAKFSIRASHKI